MNPLQKCILDLYLRQIRDRLEELEADNAWLRKDNARLRRQIEELTEG